MLYSNALLLRDYMLQENNFKCEICGSSSMLEVHHIIPRGEAPELILESDNVKLLCKQCHRKTHVEMNKLKPKKESALKGVPRPKGNWTEETIFDYTVRDLEEMLEENKRLTEIEEDFEYTIKELKDEIELLKGNDQKFDREVFEQGKKGELVLTKNFLKYSGFQNAVKFEVISMEVGIFVKPITLNEL